MRRWEMSTSNVWQTKVYDLIKMVDLAHTLLQDMMVQLQWNKPLLVLIIFYCFNI